MTVQLQYLKKIFFFTIRCQTKDVLCVCLAATLAWVYCKTRGKVEMTDLEKMFCKNHAFIMYFTPHFCLSKEFQAIKIKYNTKWCNNFILTCIYAIIMQHVNSYKLKNYHRYLITTLLYFVKKCISSL